MLLIGAIGGYLAHLSSWVPSITGFMAVGLLFGPSGIGLLSQETMVESHILIDIALALILYRLGLSLDIKLILRTPSLLLISLFESTATFGLVFFTLHLCGISYVLAALVAAIAISSSAAVLIHVAHEVGAKGEVTESSKTLVALNNLISFFVFTAVLPALLFSSGASLTTIILQPLYQLVGSLLLGIALAYGLHTIASRTHRAPQYKLALVIGTIMLAIGLAQTSSTLFPQYAATVTAIVLGAVTVFESIGPPIAAFAFKYAGEVTVNEFEDTTDQEVPHNA